jgi:hypothetical protein
MKGISFKIECRDRSRLSYGGQDGRHVFASVALGQTKSVKLRFSEKRKVERKDVEIYAVATLRPGIERTSTPEQCSKLALSLIAQWET